MLFVVVLRLDRQLSDNNNTTLELLYIKAVDLVADCRVQRLIIIMLRHAVAKSAHQLKNSAVVVNSTRRSYAAATSKQKRALSKQQLQGKKPALKPDPPAESPPPPPPAAAATAVVGDGGDGGGNIVPIVVIGTGLLGAAGYYYLYGMEEAEEGGEAPAAPKKEEAKEAVVEEKKTETVTTTKEATIEKRPTSVRADDGSNRVLQIEVPSGTTPSAPPTAAVSHPEGGSRVTMESFQQPSASSKNRISVTDSLKELQAQIDQETSDVVRRANQEVMRSFDESLFEGLDDMTASQLKARVFQLATEMKERTRWEALRLKEFLALKEKETADKYVCCVDFVCFGVDVFEKDEYYVV